MEPRRLAHESEKIEDVWDELVYSEALLLHDKDASDLVLPTTALIVRAEAVRLGQLNCWRGETKADAGVSERNYLLDIQTRRFERQLRRELEDRGLDNVTELPAYKTYFSVSLSRVIEMGLESQIKFMEPWITHLEKEPSASLQEFTSIFQEEFVQGKKALDTRVRAEATTRNHRVTEITRLFDDANTERRSLAGILTTRSAERRLPDYWPSKFFRRAKRHTKPSPDQLRREAIFAVLYAKNISLSDEQKQKLQRERDSALLDKWLSRAPTSTNGDDLFAE